MLPYEIIYRKRCSLKLTKEEIEFFVKGAIDGSISEAQIAAFLMACFINGLSEEETVNLTLAMANSGDVLNINVDGFLLDKHSTGGVGDGTSLVIAPVLASFGVYVPMISGRGLGHTGGTLDKLESIPGFNVNLDVEEFLRVLNIAGCVIAGAGKNLAPADSIFYRIRDVTATVDSIPLITASILSKKFAEGCNGIVFDVKTGSGAFMKKFSDSKKLAKLMVKVFKALKKKAVAVITSMDEPLGEYAGNSLEVIQAVRFLKGSYVTDFKEVTFALIKEGLKLAGMGVSYEEIDKKIRSGKPLEVFLKMAELQGADAKILEKEALTVSKNVKEVKLGKEGYINKIDTENLGFAVVELGGGRRTPGERIDHSVGIKFLKKIGDKISSSEPFCVLYYRSEDEFNLAARRIKNAVKIGPKRDKIKKVIEVIDGY